MSRAQSMGCERYCSDENTSRGTGRLVVADAHGGSVRSGVEKWLHHIDHRLSVSSTTAQRSPYRTNNLTLSPPLFPTSWAIDPS